MMHELPEGHVTIAGSLSYSTTDTGDRFVVFQADNPAITEIKNGLIAGFIVPREVPGHTVDQFLGAIRDRGIRFVFIPRESIP